MELLYLHPAKFSQKQLNVAKNIFNRNGFQRHTIGAFSLTAHTEREVGYYPVKFKGNGKFVWDPKGADTARRSLKNLITRLKPKAIVINCREVLQLITGQWSTNTCRGSIYLVEDIPSLVVDDIFLVFHDKTYPFFLGNDIQKLKRWVANARRPEPSLNLQVCASRDDIRALRQFADHSVFISLDIETSKVGITSISFTCLGFDGYLRTFVVPFVNPLNKPSGCYWDTEEDEIFVWEQVKAICENDRDKVLQNGCYDAAWLMRNKIAVRTFFYDTQHMWRSIWPECEKALDVITSVMVDTYRFWKDEIKGDTKKDKKTQKRVGKTVIPKTKDGFAMYLRYNGLDTHYTALSFIQLTNILCRKDYDWALFNYTQDEWPVQMGPNFAMTMRGLKMDLNRQMMFNERWRQESARALEELRIMADTPEFNPSSPDQVKQLLFKVLGARMPNIRGKGIKRDPVTGAVMPSTDEKILKFIRLQHPILAKVIDKIWETKKPLNNASKYGEMKDYHGRYMYGISILTECNRASSSNHPYWYGTNAQNIPVKIRSMFTADPGKFICNSDYSQSDAYFVAFYSEDPQYINNILRPEDTHCIHAEFFFREPYEKIYKRYKEKDPWAVDPIKGVRQNTKRVTHGAGYQMQGGTLYVTMGHEAALATALALGYTEATKWTSKEFGVFCQLLINRFYNELYPRLPVWFTESCEAAIKNKNKAMVYGGRTRHFFGDIAKDPSVRREISAWFGQGGTAANVNQTVKKAWYNGLDVATGGSKEAGFMMHLQVHDSIVNQVNQNNPGLRALDQFLTYMETPVTILGRTFVVPTETEIGISWEGASVPYKPGLSVEELLPRVLEAEAKLNAKLRAT